VNDAHELAAYRALAGLIHGATHQSGAWSWLLMMMMMTIMMMMMMMYCMFHISTDDFVSNEILLHIEYILVIEFSCSVV